MKIVYVDPQMNFFTDGDIINYDDHASPSPLPN